MLVDAHAHLHFEVYTDPQAVIARAEIAGVFKIICVGVNGQDSEKAAGFAHKYSQCLATAGLHPHDAKHQMRDLPKIRRLVKHRAVIAVGECGLDYHYLHSTKAEQKRALESQIELALESNLPMVFHVREAFSDFFRIIDRYPSINGVVHSFSAGLNNLNEILSRNLHVGLNGITTFSKDEDHLRAAKNLPLDKLLLETDAPFLTPPPHRGKINEPQYLKLVAEFLVKLRGRI